jgi:hypothetical protein
MKGVQNGFFDGLAAKRLSRICLPTANLRWARHFS